MAWFQAASNEVRAKKLLGFKTPARSIVSLPMGRASRIHRPKDKFCARETLKMATEKKTPKAGTENDATLRAVATSALLDPVFAASASAS